MKLHTTGRLAASTSKAALAFQVARAALLRDVHELPSTPLGRALDITFDGGA